MPNPITAAPFINASSTPNSAAKNTSSPAPEANSFQTVLARQKESKAAEKTAEKSCAKTADPTRESPNANNVVAESVAAPSSNDGKASPVSSSLDNKSTKPDSPDAASTAPNSPDNLIALLQPLQELRNALSAPMDRASNNTLTASGAAANERLDASGKPLASRAHTLANTLAGSPVVNAATVDADTQFKANLSEKLSNTLVAASDSKLALNSVAPRAEELLKFATPNLLSNPIGNTNKLPDSPVQSIAAPFGSAAWSSEFTQKISWMSNSKLDQVAELHLNPPNLGPLDVVLKISDNQATAMFSSPHLAVREAVENAMPKLRELLADNGITLGNTSVSDQAPRDNNPSNSNEQSLGNRWANPSNNASDEAVRSMSPPITVQRHNGLVDTFA
ncbi:MAG: hypothetical protein RL358_662 [Pseudomonadota bacterium]|jgi:flagellar hook-length control protein FliK